MLVSNSKRQLLNKLLGEFTAKISEDFMILSAGAKENKNDSLKSELVDNTFRRIMDFNKALSKEVHQLLDGYDSFSSTIEKLNNEKSKFERLYASGILFQSETEMVSLMEKAVETVVKELEADEGFIVLVNEQQMFDTIVAKNMDHEVEHSAKEMSTSIIKNTIASLEPLQLNDLKAEEAFSLKHSVVTLGLTAAVCVPLISGQKVLGAVYIDRRNKTRPFKDSDLLFLTAFAKQIVKGLEVSLEIRKLEEKLENKPKQDFALLRNKFKSEELIGSSIKLFNVLNLASKVTGTDASVLILGENGTGKELLAYALHNNSARANKPFVALNCGAIPPNLLESELFGYESGAFTGAVKSKPGRLEIAEGGTVFLDEIGELSVSLQAKLLRVIQNKEIERLGGIESKKIDVRFIAATNRNLSAMIAEKSFREDLYYRLKVIELVLPPLRERREDIEELSKYFLKKFAGGSEEFNFSQEALFILERYNWPGNVRELENVIQRCVILSKGNTITPGDLPPEIFTDNFNNFSISKEMSLEEAENEFRKMYLLKIIRKAGSKSEAAKILKINRSHLHKLISQLEISL
ncbi:MAG: sigma-54-dependent Fis family transcriptional regulator [Bacteroidota bacterium]